MARRNPESTVTGGATPATRTLTAAGVAYTPHTFTVDDRSRRAGQPTGKAQAGQPAGKARSYGAEAARLLGVEEERVFKTLITEIDGELWVAVVPVSAQLDVKALAAAAGGKRAAMAEPADAERSTGYVTGGISPLGQRRQLPTVVDASASEHSSIFVSGGRRGLDLELAASDLIRLTSARTATIARQG